jgi:arylsulfatase A-like enzyme
MDIYTTCIKLAGGDPPTDRIVDGVDLTPVLKGTGKSPRDTMFYYRGQRLFAVRHGPFKAHFTTQAGYGGGPQQHDPPLLFNLDIDPSEKYDVAKDHADVIAAINTIVADHKAKLDAPPSRLERRIGE